MPDDIIGGLFTLDVTSVGSATTPTLDVAITVTPDDTNYYVVSRWAQVTAASKLSKNVNFLPFLQAATEVTHAYTGGVLTANFPMSRKFGFYWTLGGTSPTITFAITFIGYRLATLGTGV
jgi:hypothetical protein